MKGCLRTLGIGFFIFALAVAGLVGYWSWNTNQQVDASETFTPAADAPGQIMVINDRAIHVQTKGSTANPPLLLIHGFGVEAGFGWGVFADDLAADYYVIMPDLLGFGHSERVTESVDDYTHTGQAALVAAVLDELSISQTDIIGASYGGGVALQMALDYPEKVNRLILIGGQVYELGGGVFQTIGNLPFGVGRALTWTALGAGPRSEALATSGCESGGYCPSAEVLATRLRLAQIQRTTDTLLAINNTPVNARIPAEVSSVPNQTLLIWGENDEIIPLENSDRLLNDLPAVERIIMPELGHSPYREQPEETADFVREFLSS